MKNEEKNVKINSKIFNNKFIPSSGNHYYYFNENDNKKNYYLYAIFPIFNRSYITINKFKEEKNYYYKIYYSFRKTSHDVYKNFIKTFRNDINKNQINVFYVDTTTFDPYLSYRKIKYVKPCKHQNFNIEHIYNGWKNNEFNNFKVILHGKRGSGKTSIGSMLKKYIDNLNKNMNCMLFYDFDPSNIGADIKKLILNNSDELTPLIIVINEFDVFLDKTNQSDIDHDPRIKHTRSKSSFNNMLDDIANTKNTIFIATTEKSKKDLNHEKYKSFLRKGLIDDNINIDKCDCF